MLKLNFDKPTIFEDLRFEQRLTAKHFAERLDITPGAYHHLEQGNTWPSFGTILKTMEVCNVSFERFEQYYREREGWIKKTLTRKDKRVKQKKTRPVR